MGTLRDRPTRVEFRRVLAEVARSEEGYYEFPFGSNLTKYGAWYGLNPGQWCAMFVSWCYAQTAERLGCENPLVGLQTRKGFARCTSTYHQARKLGIILGPNEPVMVGDVLIWAKTKSMLLSVLTRANGHTGVVTAVHKDAFTVTEGNTNGAYSRTGGNVMAHGHSRTDGRHGRLLAIYRPVRLYSRK